MAMAGPDIERLLKGAFPDAQVVVAWPSTRTAQAKHCSSPQPYLAAVKPRSLRSTCKNGVSGSTATSSRRPLMSSSISSGTSCRLS